MIPTASSIERAIDCVFSTVAEQAPDNPNPARKRGELIHAVIAATLRDWPMPDIGRHQISVDFDQLREYLGAGDMRCELAMSYRPDARLGGVLGENIGRGYPSEPGFLYGSADIVVIRDNALVFDTKTGRHRAAPVAENWQARTLAVMLAHAYPIKTVTACMGYVARDGSWYFDDCQWSGFDIADFAEELEVKHGEWIAAQTVAPAPTPTARACQWCKAAGCPARIQREVAA